MKKVNNDKKRKVTEYELGERKVGVTNDRVELENGATEKRKKNKE